MLHRIEYVQGEKLERRDVEGLDYTTPAVKMPTPDEIRRYVEANRRKPTGGEAPGQRRERAKGERAACTPR